MYLERELTSKYLARLTSLCMALVAVITHLQHGYDGLIIDLQEIHNAAKP